MIILSKRLRGSLLSLFAGCRFVARADSERRLNGAKLNPGNVLSVCRAGLQVYCLSGGELRRRKTEAFTLSRSMVEIRQTNLDKNVVANPQP